MTLECMFKNLPHKVIFTDAEFKDYAEKKGLNLAQVPYHKSRRFYLSFILGNIPEWKGNYSTRWLTKHLIEEFRSVYAFIYSVDCLKFANWIAQRLDIPFFVHIADHSVAFENDEVRKILSRCKRLLCITNEMKYKYEAMIRRKDIEILHNGAERECFNIRPPVVSNFSEKNPFILCFIGGLFSYLHGDCIEDCFQAVAKIRKIIPWVEFHLYGQRQPTSFLDKEIQMKGVFHHGVIMPLEKKYSIMEKAHCFLIPSSFNLKYHESYKLSFPTKLPELIASRRPILSYGPLGTSTNRLLQEHKIGLRLHKRSIHGLTTNLIEIIEDYSVVLKNSLASKKIVEEKYSADAVRSKLERILIQ